LKRIQVYVRAEATVLWRILGILAVEQQPECSAKEPAAVAGKQRENRIGISGQRALDVRQRPSADGFEPSSSFNRACARPNSEEK